MLVDMYMYKFLTCNFSVDGTNGDQFFSATFGGANGLPGFGVSIPGVAILLTFSTYIWVNVKIDFIEYFHGSQNK